MRCEVIRNPLSHNLPSGFTEYDYIESNGTPYIDLNLSGNLASYLFEISGNFTTRGSIFGSRITASSNNIVCAIDANNLFLDFNNSSFSPYRLTIASSNVFSKNIAITIGASVRKVIDTDNGTLLGENTIQNTDVFNIVNSLYLFGANGSPSEAGKSAGKIHHFSAKTEDNFVRNLVPCHNDTTDKFGMYDLVSQTFFGNSGSGAFTGGNVVDKFILQPVTPCEVLSDGQGGLVLQPVESKEVSMSRVVYQNVKLTGRAGLYSVQFSTALPKDHKIRVSAKVTNNSGDSTAMIVGTTGGYAIYPSILANTGKVESVEFTLGKDTLEFQLRNGESHWSGSTGDWENVLIEDITPILL